MSGYLNRVPKMGGYGSILGRMTNVWVRVRVNAAQVSSRGNVDTGAANSLKRRGAT